MCSSDLCEDGTVYIGAWVGNAGNLEAPAGIPVSLTAGPTGAVLDTQYTTDVIAPGDQGEALIFAVSAADLGSAKPTAKADYDGSGAGVVLECDETNNVYDWGHSVCN